MPIEAKGGVPSVSKIHGALGQLLLSKENEPRRKLRFLFPLIWREAESVRCATNIFKKYGIKLLNVWRTPSWALINIENLLRNLCEISTIITNDQKHHNYKAASSMTLCQTHRRKMTMKIILLSLSHVKQTEKHLQFCVSHMCHAWHVEISAAQIIQRYAISQKTQQ